MIEADSFKEEHLARKKKGAWGGYRPGAGRKRMIEDSVRLTLRISSADIGALDEFAEQAGINLSEYVRRILHRHIAARRS